MEFTNTNKIAVITTSEGDLKITKNEWAALKAAFPALPTWSELLCKNFTMISYDD